MDPLRCQALFLDIIYDREYTPNMIETADMKGLPKGLSDDELKAILTGSKGETRLRNFRLSLEAQRILASESERLGLDETKTLELLLREIREIREIRKKKRG